MNVKLEMPGKVTVFTGPTGSGKTVKLLTAIQGFTKGSPVKAQVFAAGKEAMSKRGECVITDHNQLKSHEGTLVGGAAEIFTHLDADTSVIGIDRANLLGKEIIDVVQTLRARGCQVFVAGNNMNTRMEPYILNGSENHTFGDVICISDETKILTAQCVYSGRTDARYSVMNDCELKACTLDLHPQKTDFIQSVTCDVRILRNEGWIRLICGPMGSNKTTTILGELSTVAGSSVLFKPDRDTRGNQTVITDHTGKISASAVMISESAQMLSHIPFGVRNIFIDEFFMLDDGLTDVLQLLRARGYQVTLSGLNTDFRMQPFLFQGSERSTGELFAIADRVDFLKSKHVYQDVSGAWRYEDAGFTRRLSNDGDQLQVGGFGEYESVSISGHPMREVFAYDSRFSFPQ